MSNSRFNSALRVMDLPPAHPERADGTTQVRSPTTGLQQEPLLTVDDVARRLNVSNDWVWDHSSRRKPRLPVIYISDGSLRYRASAIEAFIVERERLSASRVARR